MTCPCQSVRGQAFRTMKTAGLNTSQQFQWTYLDRHKPMGTWKTHQQWSTDNSFLTSPLSLKIKADTFKRLCSLDKLTRSRLEKQWFQFTAQQTFWCHGTDIVNREREVTAADKVKHASYTWVTQGVMQVIKFLTGSCNTKRSRQCIRTSILPTWPILDVIRETWQLNPPSQHLVILDFAHILNIIYESE